LLPASPPVTVGAGEYLLLVKDTGLFKSRYTAPAGVQVLAWGVGKLVNGMGKIQLSKPGTVDANGMRHWIRVDRVVYSDGSRGRGFPVGADPWPGQANGGGASLNRIDSAAYGNDPANWRAAVPSPGAANEQAPFRQAGP